MTARTEEYCAWLLALTLWTLLIGGLYGALK